MNNLAERNSNPYQSPDPYYPYDGTKILNYETKIRSLEEYIRQLESESSKADFVLFLITSFLVILAFLIGSTLGINCSLLSY